MAEEVSSLWMYDVARFSAFQAQSPIKVDPINKKPLPPFARQEGLLLIPHCRYLRTSGFIFGSMKEKRSPTRAARDMKMKARLYLPVISRVIPLTN